MRNAGRVTYGLCRPGQRRGRNGRPWVMALSRIVSLWSALVLAWPVWANTDTIVVAPGRYGYDPDLGLLVVAMTGAEVEAEWGQPKDAVLAGSLFTFGEALETVETGARYDAVDSLGNAVAVYFTDLPLIQVTSDEDILDEPKVPGHFSMWSTEQEISGYRIGIEYRGGSSQALPKKSYLIEFRQDTSYSITRNVALLGMRSDDDWNLEAFSIEPLRLRSMTAFELWMDIHSPYYAFLEPDAQSGVRHEYAELFVNGSYRGLYGVGERVDRKQLQVKEFDGSYRGEIFKGNHWGVPTLTTSPPPYVEGAPDWAGFRGIYPKEFPDWASLWDFVHFVVEAPDAQFHEEVDMRFHRANAIDYLLFLNLLKAEDNTGKNIYIARYKEYEPYFYVPWDLDGIFGLYWDGGLTVSPLGMLSNGLYNRWNEDLSWQGFRQALCDRWQDLRAQWFTVPALMQRLTAHHDRLQASGVYEREELAWDDYAYDAGNLGQMENWLTERLDYLDTEIGAACLSLGMEGQESAARMQVYPNPASDRVVVELQQSVADMRIELYNALGQLQLQQAFTGNVATVNVQRLAAGTYLLRAVHQGVPLATRTLVVQ